MKNGLDEGNVLIGGESMVSVVWFHFQWPWPSYTFQFCFKKIKSSKYYWGQRSGLERELCLAWNGFNWRKIFCKMQLHHFLPCNLCHCDLEIFVLPMVIKIIFAWLLWWGLCWWRWWWKCNLQFPKRFISTKKEGKESAAKRMEGQPGQHHHHQQH